MRLGKYLLAAAAASMATAPALAAPANPAASLSVTSASGARVGAPTTSANREAGEWLIAAAAVAAIVAGILVLSHHHSKAKSA